MPFRAPGAGVLGPRPPFQPQQAKTAASNPNAFDTSALYSALQSSAAPQPPPSASEWYFDTEATSHMSSSPGNFPLHTLRPSSSVITVGNGARMPATHRAQTIIPTATSPLRLDDVLISPSLIKNLISVPRLTRDNDVSIEFDPMVFQSRIFTHGRRGSDVTAAVISTPFVFHTIKLFTVHQQRPCGISGLGIPGLQLLLKSYRFFLLVVIRLMHTHVPPVS